MSICGAHTISSLSHDWIRSVVASGRFADHVWNRRERVPVDTLDHLMARFGRPSFIKIDVEGFEDQVVAGLSRPVPEMSVAIAPLHAVPTGRDPVIRLREPRRNRRRPS